MEIKSNSPMNSRKKIWKYYDNLDYLRGHVELFRLDECNERTTNPYSNNKNDTPTREISTEYITEIPSNSNSMIRHDYGNSGKNKTSTIKVLVEDADQTYDTTEYTVFEANQDGDLEEVGSGNNDDMYLEPIESSDYITNEEGQENDENDNTNSSSSGNVVNKRVKKEQQVEIISSVYSNDPDEKFLMSCLPVLKRLPAKKNALLKLKIQTLLYEVEFCDSEDDSTSIGHKKRKT